MRSISERLGLPVVSPLEYATKTIASAAASAALCSFGGVVYNGVGVVRDRGDFNESSERVDYYSERVMLGGDKPLAVDHEQLDLALQAKDEPASSEFKHQRNADAYQKGLLTSTAVLLAIGGGSSIKRRHDTRQTS